MPRRVGVTVIIIAVAIVVVLVLSLLLLAALGSTGSGSSGSPGAVPFSSARATSDQLTAPRGAWVLADALGIDLANATTEPLNLSSVPENCTLTSLAGPLPSSLTIPSYAGNLSDGLAAYWELVYFQPSTGSEIATVLIGGSVSVAIELSGPNCLGNSSGLFTGIPNNIVDSPAAAAVVVAAGAGAFLDAHPTGVSVTMSLFPFGEFGSTSPDWEFTYSTCGSFFGPGSESPGDEFIAAVNATSGELVPQSTSNETCGTPPPSNNDTIGSALQLGPATLVIGAGTGGTLSSQGCRSGDYCYSIPIEMASENVTPGDFEATVVSGTNESTSPAVGYAITSASGDVLVFASGPVEEQWTPALGSSSTLLAAGMNFIVDMGTTDPSSGFWLLNLTGTGPFGDSSAGWEL